ncbi:unnamed protein product, partial [Didymodactylos carnosus]
HIFPPKRTFLLFGCIYDVSMIDKSFGNTTICFELSIGSSGYLNPQQLNASRNVIETLQSLTRPYARTPLDNNIHHYRLPIDLQKPIMCTRYEFHDYAYRMTISNRFKNAAEIMNKGIREFELKLESNSSIEELETEYRKLVQYLTLLPCNCKTKSDKSKNDGSEDQTRQSSSTMGSMRSASSVTTTHTVIAETEQKRSVHPTLYEVLNFVPPTIKLNKLDKQRGKKLLHNLESLKSWIVNDVHFDLTNKKQEMVKELRKIAKALEQLAIN